MTTVLLVLLLILFLSGAPLFGVMVAAAAIGALGLPRGMTEEFGGYMASLFGLGTGDLLLEQVGREAVRQLVRQLNGQEAEPLTLLPTELVIRESCGCTSLTLNGTGEVP